MERFSRILVAVDLSDQAENVIRHGLRLARDPSDEILLVHVVHDLESIFGVYVCDKPLPSLQSEIELEGKAKLRQLFKEHVDQGRFTGRELLLTGSPWSEIVGCAIRHRADVVVMGAHTSEKPEHRILGSTVNRVLKQAPCPVLVVPPEE